MSEVSQETHHRLSEGQRWKDSRDNSPPQGRPRGDLLEYAPVSTTVDVKMQNPDLVERLLVVKYFPPLRSRCIRGEGMQKDVLTGGVEWQKHCNGHDRTDNQTKRKERGSAGGC